MAVRRLKSTKTIDLTEYKEALRDTRKYVSRSLLDDEILELNALKEKYKNIPKHKNVKARLDLLMNALVESNTHEERLVEIRVILSRCQRIAEKQYALAKNAVIQSMDVLGKTKKDQDLLFEMYLGFFDSVSSDVAYKIEQVDFVLEQVRNTAYNLKTMISVLKTMQEQET